MAKNGPKLPSQRPRQIVTSAEVDASERRWAQTWNCPPNGPVKSSGLEIEFQEPEIVPVPAWSIRVKNPEFDESVTVHRILVCEVQEAEAEEDSNPAIQAVSPGWRVWFSQTV
jgi:hypothetical protein